MNTQDGNKLSRLTGVIRTHYDKETKKRRPPLNKKGNTKRCSSCLDLDTGNLWKCTRCSIDICTQKNGSGCLKLLRDVSKTEFMCRDCMITMGSLDIPYEVESYFRGSRRQRSNNALWVAYLSNSGRFVMDVVSRHLLAQFASCSDNLYMWTRDLTQPLAPSLTSSETDKALFWMRNVCKHAKDILVMVNADCDAVSGNVILPERQMAMETVIPQYCGVDDFKDILDLSPPQDVLRGVIILKGRSCMNVRARYEELVAEVKKSHFDFILVFTHSDLSQEDLSIPLMRFIEHVYIDHDAPWQALQNAFGDKDILLETSPMLIFSDAVNVHGQRAEVHTRVLSRDHHLLPFGLEYWRSLCSCKSTLPKLSTNYNTYGTETLARIQCMKCQATPRSVKRPNWVISIEGGKNLVYYNWPLSKDQVELLGRQHDTDVIIKD